MEMSTPNLSIPPPRQHHKHYSPRGYYAHQAQQQCPATPATAAHRNDWQRDCSNITLGLRPSVMLLARPAASRVQALLLQL